MLRGGRAIRIRDFESADAPQIRSLLQAHGWEDRYIRGQLDALKNSSDWFAGAFVAAADEVEGFVTVQLYSWNRLAQVHGVAVRPRSLRRGIGSRLITEAERFAYSRGSRGIYVDTPVTNKSARSFYRRLGYVESYAMPRYYADDIDGITLVKFARGGAMTASERITRPPSEDDTQPGPSPTADDTTAADMGLVGGTGADVGQGTAWPIGTELDERR